MRCYSLNRFIRSRVLPRYLAAATRPRARYLAATRQSAWHGVANTRVCPSLRLEAYYILEDNYSFVLVDEANQEATMTDAAQPSVMVEVAYGLLKEGFIETTQLWTTHKHWDHAGGNNEVSQLLGIKEIVGPLGEAVEGCTRQVEEGDFVRVGGAELEVWEMPCHTRGHVAFYLPPAVQQDSSLDDPIAGQAGTARADPTLDLGQGISATVPSATGPHHRSGAPMPSIIVRDVQRHGCLLAGDVLFSQGCGRFFEGTAKDMLKNADRIAALPDTVLLCCGHEYTLTNARFAAWLEPGNYAVKRRLDEVSELRAPAGGAQNSELAQTSSEGDAVNQTVPLPTVPSALGREKQVNPFLRCRETRVKEAVRAKAIGTLRGDERGEPAGWDWEDPVVVLGAMRKLRDQW